MTRGQRLLAGAVAAAALAALIVAPLSLNRYGLYVLSLWAVMSIAAIGLNLTLGYAGQVSLAQGAFVGVGAYAAAILTTHGCPLAVAIVVALALSFVIGWLLGYPALRVQHHYLAFVTLAFSTLAFLVFRNEEWLTGGIYGISGVPRPSLFGFSAAKPLPFYYVCLFALGRRHAGLLGPGSLALGPRFHGAARESAARRLARRRHAALYADGLRHRLGAGRPRRARSTRR